jgi:hypothetical protein
MIGEVFYGEPEKPLPNWREHPRPDGDDDEDRPRTEEEQQSLIGMLGFDYRELDDGGEPEVTESALHESAPPATIPETPAQRLARRAEEIWREEYP